MTLTPSSTSDASMWLQTNRKLGVSPITHLFNRLDGAYPGKWRQFYPSEISIENWEKTWVEAFVEDGITPMEIKTGLSNCRRMYDWPPSITEFIRACRPGLDPETAFHEAVRGLSARRRGEPGTWTHPAVFYAAVDVGQHDVMNCSYQLMRGRWEKALSGQLSKGAWQPIAAPAPSLPEPKKTELTNREAKAAMDRLGIAGITKPTERNQRAWAKRLLERAKGKSPLVIAMAQKVAGAQA